MPRQDTLSPGVVSMSRLRRSRSYSEYQALRPQCVPLGGTEQGAERSLQRYLGNGPMKGGRLYLFFDHENPAD
jgi:hypothetical protein